MTMRTSRTLAALTLVSALALTACGGGASGDGANSVKLRLASPLPGSGTYGLALQHWADAVEEESGGAIEIEVHTSGALLSGTDIMPGVADGRADLGLLFSNYHPEQLTLFNAVATPFVANSAMATASTFTQLYEESPEMQEQFDNAGVEPLTFILNGAASTGTREALETVDELDGQRIRVPGTVGEMLSLVGADAVFLELTELYEGVSRGVVDGWSGMDFSSAVSLDVGDITPYVTDLGIGQYASAAIIVNPDAFEGLSSEQQEVLETVSARYPEALADVMTENETNACDQLIEAGGSVSRLSDAEIEAFRAATEDAINDKLREASMAAGLTAEAHDAFIERYRELMTSYDNPEGYTDGLTACTGRS